ncbi:MAG: hypothetical protein BWY73_00754 [candidate division TA06 bacterium ADurb.Bin417]|uniref:Uncharacterized protein n=1 Tax=candidate division TA06 bacterium ADurb.Bin417 TaxID=1852828 RepID=A0A1V5MIC2_UNCT6|nr:MAG: hypothetical protein BWY73_00754 [candidate division TA06 bacterium ADurb.Bin417]
MFQNRTRPRVTRTAITKALTIRPLCMTSSRRRLLTWSASTPAGRENKSRGSPLMLLTTPSMKAESVTWRVSQPKTVFCIQPPQELIAWPIQKRRKLRWRIAEKARPNPFNNGPAESGPAGSVTSVFSLMSMLPSATWVSRTGAEDGAFETPGALNERNRRRTFFGRTAAIKKSVGSSNPAADRWSHVEILPLSGSKIKPAAAAAGKKSAAGTDRRPDPEAPGSVRFTAGPAR